MKPILTSPRFPAGAALLAVVVALCLAGCDKGADRTPKKADDIKALLKERDSAVASQVSESVVAVVAERDHLCVQAQELMARLTRIESILETMDDRLSGIDSGLEKLERHRAANLPEPIQSSTCYFVVEAPKGGKP